MRILLADDDKSLRRVLQFKLKKHGHEVTAVEDGQLALDQLRGNRWDLLLSDVKMPNVDGIELLEQAKRLQPDLKVILITAHSTISQAVRAVKLGAFDYITKPFEDDQLLVAIDKATAFRRIEKENLFLRSRLEQNAQGPELIGISKPFKEMMKLVDTISATDATVMLTGASGTGKELVARAIHQRSGRADREFVAINCGALPPDLIESELFGHVKGAFTGAIREKKGKFEVADGGTILLDEVSELAIELQVKLLRVLQERVVEPVGSEEIRQIDVRVVGATNVDLRKRVSEGRFREDLFYRLNVIPIAVPGLTERKDDIPVLVEEFVRRHAHGDEVTVSPKLLERFAEYSWPGNIRELGNLVERMVILRKSNTISVRDLPADFSAKPTEATPGEDSPTGHLTFYEAEERMIREALDRCGWNRTRAAKYLNVPRHVLLYRMKKYNIREDSSAPR